jgi:hypothetical protein
LDLNNIRLSAKNIEKLRLENRAMPKAGAGDYTDLIDYKEALRSIQPNLEKDEPLEKEWTLSKTKNRNATETFSTISMSIKTHLSNNH